MPILVRFAELAWLYVEASVFGDADASYSLGEARLTGEYFEIPVPTNPGRAAGWYLRAALRGHRDAQYELGFMLLLGEGIDRDLAAGARWMRRSAASGHPEAMRVLADGYSTDALGIDPDPALASTWAEKLAAHLESHPEDRRGYERS